MDRTPTSRDRLLAAAKDGATDGLLVRKAMVADVEKVEGAERTVRFVISTGSVDRDNDTINPKGWDLSSYLKNPVVLWAHDYRQLPVGRAVSVTLSGDRLVSDCEFASHPFADTVFQLVQGGFLRATSVGFRPRKYQINEERHGLDFAEQELMEYSVVPVPANPEALIDMAAAKAAGIDVEPLRKWAADLLQAAGPDPEPAPAKAPETMEPDAEGKCRDGYRRGEDGMCHLVEKPEAAKAEPEAKEPQACCSCSATASAPCGTDGCDHQMCAGCAKDGACPCHASKAAALQAELVVDVKVTAPGDGPATCRICEQELRREVPRLRDDLGVVCAPCFVRAGAASEPAAEPPAAGAPDGAPDTKEAVLDLVVLDLDDDPREGVVVELDDDDSAVVDLSPEEVRAALRSAVTSVVSAIVRDETRAAFNRARGRVD